MTHPGTVVMVAYYAPPAAGIAANRLLGMVRHLPEAGWDPVVVAPGAVHHHRDSEARFSDVRVIRTRNPEPSRWLRRLAGRSREGEAPSEGVHLLRPAEVSRLGGVARRWVRSWLYVPDAQFPWIGPAARAAAEAVKASSGPTVLYSTSVPYSAHFAAMRAAALTGAPWVAEYRDPWSAAPPQFGRRPALRRLIDRRLDASVVRGASRVVVTTAATRRLFLETFPELAPEEIHVVRNGWEERTEARPPGPERPLKLLYSGTLLHWRWAVPLLEALGALPGGASVRLRVLGPEEPWRRAQEEVGTRVEALELAGMVPASEMPTHLAEASALVLLQPEERLALYVAGKAYEYLGSRRPVLAWIPGDGEMAELLRTHGDLRWVQAGSSTEFLAALEGLLEGHRAGTLQEPRVPWTQVEPLSRRAQAGLLAGVFDELGAAGGSGVGGGTRAF